MVDPIATTVLVESAACSGRTLVLDAPLSFWGGVDPETGLIIHQHHPQCGTSIAGTVLCLPATVGSSSSSSVLLELVHRGLAPAAIVVISPDAILLMALIAAREMSWPYPPAVQVGKAEFAGLKDKIVDISTDGVITLR